MSIFYAGVIVIVLGAASLILQLLIDPNRPELPDRRTAKQEKNWMVMAGIVGIMIGTLLMILSR
ncbi:MAG: hypothetical protein FJ215_10815 [Ignavibacteria bacterium]|nr:hypothetical protein [Ignavibacteria bacterium]